MKNLTAAERDELTLGLAMQLGLTIMKLPQKTQLKMTKIMTADIQEAVEAKAARTGGAE